MATRRRLTLRNPTRNGALLAGVGDGENGDRTGGRADEDDRGDAAAGDGADDAVILSVRLGDLKRVPLSVDEGNGEVAAGFVGELLVGGEDVGREIEPVDISRCYAVKPLGSEPRTTTTSQIALPHD
ncbi:hypothetical protein [Streptomyces hydrogenans]|uniref:hypothetical protein n=1 Tax=Streptomyces hydrogenans TaxID=1873719 RepID=UPI0035DC0E9D